MNHYFPCWNMQDSVVSPIFSHRTSLTSEKPSENSHDCLANVVSLSVSFFKTRVSQLYCEKNCACVICFECTTWWSVRSLAYLLFFYILILFVLVVLIHSENDWNVRNFFGRRAGYIFFHMPYQLRQLFDYFFLLTTEYFNC